MSDNLARAALARMNLREQAVAHHYQEGMASDLMQMARTDPTQAHEKFMTETRHELCAAYGFGRSQADKDFAFADGFAIIPIHGSLINRFGGYYGSVTGYNFIRRQHMAAVMDPDVKYIIHDHNSYGGEAAGCFELSADIKNTRGSKPIIAVVDSNCYSASYALATAADKIIVTPSGGVGSVGVVAMHVNMKGMLDKFGVEITFIHSGDHKVDGNPYEALSAEVKADLQKSIDKSRGKFVALVADNLGLDSKIIYDTQARTYRADDAMELGLVHAVAVPSAALQSVKDDDAAQAGESATKLSTNSNEEMTMDPNKEGNNTPAAGQPSAAVQPDAAATERARVKGIQTCEEAKGREALANHLAFDTAMSLDQAKAILAAAPAATTAAAPAAGSKTPFEAAMDNVAHPNVGADGAGAPNAGAGKELTADERATAVLKDFERATGTKVLEK
jgi:signal peptide peptidase SppA